MWCHRNCDTGFVWRGSQKIKTQRGLHLYTFIDGRRNDLTAMPFKAAIVSDNNACQYLSPKYSVISYLTK